MVYETPGCWQNLFCNRNRWQNSTRERKNLTCVTGTSCSMWNPGHHRAVGFLSAHRIDPVRKKSVSSFLAEAHPPAPGDHLQSLWACHERSLLSVCLALYSPLHANLFLLPFNLWLSSSVVKKQSLILLLQVLGCYVQLFVNFSVLIVHRPQQIHLFREMLKGGKDVRLKYWISIV